MIRIYVDKTAIDRNKGRAIPLPVFVVVNGETEQSAHGVKGNGWELKYLPNSSPIPGAVAFLEVESEIILVK